MNQPRSNRRFFFSASLLLALAGCTAIPKSDQQQPARPEPVPAAPPQAMPSQTVPWDQRPFDTGIWQYDGRARTAVFAQAGRPLLTLSCAGASVRLTTDRLASAGQAQAVDLKTSSGIVRLRFEPQGAQGSVLTVPSSDNKLDQIAFSRGRFALDASNGHHLTLPVHAEIGRLIEDCRG